jgi:hypothetical protein
MSMNEHADGSAEENPALRWESATACECRRGVGRRAGLPRPRRSASL